MVGVRAVAAGGSIGGVRVADGSTDGARAEVDG
jgi:hypothetical protein